MITLVTGGPDSGKSLRAEDIAVRTGDERLYYLATMKVFGDDGIARIKKHRAQREGKGFITIELQIRADKALDMMDEPEKCCVLLECIANLVGNEMHDDPDRSKLCKPKPADTYSPDNLQTGIKQSDRMAVSDGKSGYSEFVHEVMSDIKKLAAGVKDLVVVTNEYEADAGMDDDTRTYILLIDMMNEELKKFADAVIDVRNEDKDV